VKVSACEPKSPSRVSALAMLTSARNIIIANSASGGPIPNDTALHVGQNDRESLVVFVERVPSEVHADHLGRLTRRKTSASPRLMAHNRCLPARCRSPLLLSTRQVRSLLREVHRELKSRRSGVPFIYFDIANTHRNPVANTI
jgi:hypothetical protein